MLVGTLSEFHGGREIVLRVAYGQAQSTAPKRVRRTVQTLLMPTGPEPSLSSHDQAIVDEKSRWLH
jgi:hypothetical protein